MKYQPVALKRSGSGPKMPKELEMFLVKLIIAFSIQLMSLTRSFLRSFASALAPSLGKFDNSWVKRFRKRHRKLIVVRSAKKSHKRSVLLGAYNVIKEWLEGFKLRRKKEAWKNHLIFNIDETKALPSGLREKVLSASNLTEAQYQLCQDSTLYSMVSCISADGSTLFVLYIFRKSQATLYSDQPIYLPKTKFNPNTRSNNDYPIYFATAPAGYMNGELWKDVLTLFIKLAGQRQGLGKGPKKSPALLFVDGCASHLKTQTPDILAAHNITVEWFPSNTSHILQPADGAYFARYKSALQDAVARANIVELLSGDSLKRTSLLCSTEACRIASDPDVVRASFEDRGIEPYDEIKIMANAWAAIGTERTMDASQDLLDTLLTDVMFTELKAFFSTTKSTQTRYISAVNKIQTGDELPTERAPKNQKAPRAKKTAKLVAAAVPDTPDSSDEEIEGSESDEESSIDENAEDVWDLMPLEAREPPSEADLDEEDCPGCGKPSQARHLTIACFSCNEYRLCYSCRIDGKALGRHMQDPEYTQKHRNRAKRNCRK